MKKILQFFKNKNVWIFTILIVTGILASRTLLSHNFYFNMHDDLQMMRQLELEKCFKDGQIPCRWVPDMGYEYGLPLFNYYPQLPYLIGQVFRIFLVPFNDVAKFTFALGIFGSGIAMYFLSKEFFGKRGGLLSAIFYIWAPYRAVDVYVRGAMNESWAWVWFPLILLSVYKFIVTKKIKHLILLSVSFASLLLTHNVMVMIFAPVFIVWTLFWLIKEKSFNQWFKLFLSGIFSLGLSAFFTLPAIFEQKYVHIESLVTDYFQYFAHFTSLNQLFISRFWGDGPSAFGVNDGLAFPVGHIHWILIVVLSFIFLINIWKTKKIDSTKLVALFGILLGTLAAFMTHERSTALWIHFSPLKFVQFPWRFLTLNVLGYALSIGSLFYLTKDIKFLKNEFVKNILLLGLTITVISFNWNNFKPVHSGPLTDDQKFGGEAWRLQTQAGIRDYLPINAKDDPEKGRPDLAEIVGGHGIVTKKDYGTNWARFNLELKDEENIVRINIFDFPIWKVFVDDKETQYYIDKNEEWGRMYIKVPKGDHKVYLKLYNTPLRTISNLISLISWSGLILCLIFSKGTKKQF